MNPNERLPRNVPRDWRIACSRSRIGETLGRTEPDRVIGNFRHMAKESAKKAMEPYDWGVKAALQRMGEDSNPYKPGTNDYIDWLAGFKDFADDDDFLAD